MMVEDEVSWLMSQAAANPSAGKIPANREFYENRAVWRKIVRKNAAKSISCRAIPYKMKQGINSCRTGHLLSRAGNLLRLTGNCPPCAGISPDLSRLPRPSGRGNFNAAASWIDPKKSSEAVTPEGTRRKRFRDNPIQAMRVKRGGKGRPATRGVLNEK